MRITPVLWMCLFATPVMAQVPEADQVDLSLPTQPMFTGESAFGVEYTGPRTDTPEYRARGRDDLVRRGGCPTAPDGSERTVTGSVTTGIGYSSRGGSSNFNAADISLCKETVSEAGNVNTMQLNLRIAQFDGPGAYGGFGPYGGYGGYGVYGTGAYFDGFAPGFNGIYRPFPGGRVRGASWSEGRQPWR